MQVEAVEGVEEVEEEDRLEEELEDDARLSAIRRTAV
jgi:hypothetical protein